MKIVGIQFLKKSISVAFYDKNKLIGKTISSENVIDQANYALFLNNIFEELGIDKKGTYNIVFALPVELVETFTLKPLVPITKKMFSQNAKKNLILGQIESVLERNTLDYVIEYDIIDEKQLYNEKMLATILVTKKEDCVKYISKINGFKNMKPIAIDTEFEALRRLVPDDYRDIAIINYFTEDKDMIGVYLYRENSLIGIRYLHRELYEDDSIGFEIERMQQYCKTFYRNYEVERWFIFGDKNYTEGILKNEYSEEIVLSNCSFAVAAGLAIKLDCEKKHKKNSKSKKSGVVESGI